MMRRPTPRTMEALEVRSSPDARNAFDDEETIKIPLEVKAIAVRDPSPPPALSSLLAVHGFGADEAHALAEIAFALQKNGRLRLARAIFEGLTIVAPGFAYAHLGAGLMSDYLGDAAGACRHYDNARKHDPRDPRPDLNQAELFIQIKQKKKAEELIRRGHEKAKRAHDQALEDKAVGLLELLRGAR